MERLVSVYLAGTFFLGTLSGFADTIYEPYRFTTLAGNPLYGRKDGMGTEARFHFPMAVTSDSSGTLFVADTFNGSIRKIATDGRVTTLAGFAELSNAPNGGFVNGIGSEARFSPPIALAVDNSGSLYLADSGNHVLRKITADGVVSTFAGSGIPGWEDGKAEVATFYNPRGVAVHRPTGVIYVADNSISLIRKITPQREVSTIAGTANRHQSVDGPALDAAFNHPVSIVVNDEGFIYVCEQNGIIRQITPTGIVTTLPEPAWNAAVVLEAESLSLPGRFRPMALDPVGNLVFLGQEKIRKRGPDGTISDLFVSPPETELARWISGLGYTAGGDLIATDLRDSVVYRLSPTNSSRAIIAGFPGGPGFVNGAGSIARFFRNANPDPSCLTIGPTGDILMTDPGNRAVRKITPDGVVSTLFSIPQLGFEYSQLGDLALDSKGNLFLTDLGNVIYRITPGGQFSIFAGSSRGESGYVDGAAANARFTRPFGLAIDRTDNLYVIDGNKVIRKITPGGVVSTFAGRGTSGFPSQDGHGTNATFVTPKGITIDANSDLYVTDGRLIRKITASGMVTTIAGASFGSGSDDGEAAAATFYGPSDLAVDSSFNIYICDSFTSLIRKIAPSGTVTTLAGLARAYEWADGVGGDVRFRDPTGIAVAKDGTLYVVDADNFAIRKGINPALAPPTFLSGTNLSYIDGKFSFRIDAPAGRTVVVMRSLDLTNWTSIATNVSLGYVVITDVEALSASARFYTTFTR